MAFAQSVRDSVLNWFRGTTFTAAPSAVYVALLTTNPTDETGTGLVEVSTGTWSNYARHAATFGAPSGTTPRSIANSGAVDFGTAATTGTVTVTGFALYDAATSGTFLAWASFGSSAGITNGTAVSFATSALTISE